MRRTSTAAAADYASDRPTWVIGWYMHLLSNQFGVQFGEVGAMMGHLDGLCKYTGNLPWLMAFRWRSDRSPVDIDANAIKLASMYDEEHSGTDSGKIYYSSHEIYRFGPVFGLNCARVSSPEQVALKRGAVRLTMRVSR